MKLTIEPALAKRIGLAALLLLFATVVQGQTDPGPRAGPSNAGGPAAGLSPGEEKLFWAGWAKFKEKHSVSGAIEKGSGLGPLFNGNSCAQCHSQPAAGGASSSLNSPQVRRVVFRDQRLALAREPNPQMTLASLDRLPGKNQTVPSFIVADGPILVPRFIHKPDGTPDGEVHDIYTIAGRSDAPGCSLPQPDFAAEMAAHNVVFRVPTPAFGAGLVEAILDDTLVSNLASTAGLRESLRIGGRFNRSPNDGTISRFGWKAQNKSLLIFAAESYNVEMGVTNELFPSERGQTPGCLFNRFPEDEPGTQPGAASDLASVAAFMRFLAPPTPSTSTPSELNGEKLFSDIGCALCHSKSLQTGPSAFGGMSNLLIRPYSDFALHHMGPGLADHVSQGLASGDEFRTAPLWGLGQRIFFLHDGRTTDLLQAISAHGSKGQNCRPDTRSSASEACSSEANAVILRFLSLSPSQKQDILNFLRSL